MSTISADEMKRRRLSVESTLGTHAMEGLVPDSETSILLRRYQDGELTLEQFSEAMDSHAYGMVAAQRPMAGVA